MQEMPKSLKPSLEEQHKRFIETAHALGCDEDKKRFEESLGKIAMYKPPKKPIKKQAKTAAAKVT